MTSDFKSPINLGRMSPGVAFAIVEDVVATVLDIIGRAWPHVCRSAVPSDHEDHITNQLRREMVAEKNSRHPIPQLRFERETQSGDSTEEHPLGLIDVHVAYSFDESEYLAIECKKVADRDHQRAAYYVKEGICRFSCGKYSLGHRYGSLLGFVTGGTPECTARFIRDKVAAYDREKTRMRTDWGWQAETRFGIHPHLYSTKHRQQRTRNTILLLHYFLPFLPGN